MGIGHTTTPLSRCSVNFLFIIFLSEGNLVTEMPVQGTC
jgi:hypothetical protein